MNSKKEQGTIADLRAELQRLQIATDGSAPNTKILDESIIDHGSRRHLQFESETGVWLDANLYLPSSSGRKPAVILVRAKQDSDGQSTTTIAEKMMRLGQVVLEMEPRTTRMENTRGSHTGDWIAAMQANLIGRNLAIMRAHDLLRGVDLLSHLPEVEPESIRGAAKGVSGIPLLLAAAEDARIKAVWLDRTPHSLRSALDDSLAFDLPEVVIPGFVLHWDLDDLVKTMGNRHVLWTDPTNWTQRVVALGSAYRYRYILGDITDQTVSQDDLFVGEFLK